MFRCVLATEGFEQPVVEKILNEYGVINYAKSNSRSILGSLNDLAFHYRFCILDHGGVHSPEVPAIIKELNRMPMGEARGYLYPIEELRKLYKIA